MFPNLLFFPFLWKQVTLHNDISLLADRYVTWSVFAGGRMFTTLAKGNVNIEMISQGASEINISYVIEECNAVKALNFIHHSSELCTDQT